MKPSHQDRRITSFPIAMAEALDLLGVPELERPAMRSRLWGQGLADRDGVINLASPKVAAVLGATRQRCQQAVADAEEVAVELRRQRAFMAISSRCGTVWS
jgi:hypothetical protein